MGSGADLFVMPESREPSFPENASEVYTELQQSINARLARRQLKFIIDDEKHRDQLKNKGFGEKEDSEYVLKPYEALYLIYTKKLIIKDRDNTVDFDGLVRTILKRDKNILTRFMVYRDLRSRGYIPKEGFGFGVDFRVYERGEYEKKPAKYVVFGISEVQYQIFLRHKHCRAHAYASLFAYKRGSFFGNSHRRNIVMSAKGKERIYKTRVSFPLFVDSGWVWKEYQ